jgi:ABC-type Mn2+/Zn2+ transport system ATPase subunit
MIADSPVRTLPLTPSLPQPHTGHAPRPIALSVHDLTVAYRGTLALDSVSFHVHPGERVAIIGQNGAGKSTLIKAIMGLIPVRSGMIDRAGVSTQQIGYVPQHENVDWTFPVTVREVVMMGCARHIGWLRRPRAEHHARVAHALARVGMSDLAARQIGELSGGQRRRAFIARALAQQAHMLILDEPFSGVDAAAQSELLDVLDALNADGLTILLSTHDLDLAYRRFDKVLALNRRAVAYGAPQQVFTRDHLAALFGREVTVWQDGQPMRAWIDDHGCCS